MKLMQIKAVLLSLVCCVFSAQANLITLETRDINNFFDKTDLLSSWNKSTPTDATIIDSFVNHKTGKNKISMLTLSFDIKHDALWNVYAGLDAGFGAALFVNGSLIANRTDDLWWNKNWQHSDVFSVENIAFSAGTHNIQLIWAEGCCDGVSTVKFTDSYVNQEQLLTANNLATVANVPEPTSIALFGLAALGLGLRRKMAK